MAPEVCTVGLGYATRVLGVSDKVKLASWTKTRSAYEKEVHQATAATGTKGKKRHRKKLSVNAGRIPPTRRPDPEGLRLSLIHI